MGMAAGIHVKIMVVKMMKGGELAAKIQRGWDFAARAIGGTWGLRAWVFRLERDAFPVPNQSSTYAVGHQYGATN
jgi:hypothetical protein